MPTNETGQKQLEASNIEPPFEKWVVAPRPNYGGDKGDKGNKDLAFPYSEYPRTFAPYEYFSTRLSEQPVTRILDFWGEGRVYCDDLVTGFVDAYNVTHQFQLVTNGADKDKKIPNRIPTVNYDDVSVAKYVPDGSVYIITLMGAPLTAATAAEMARLIRRGDSSVIVIYGKDENDSDIHVLQAKLLSIDFALSPFYELSSELDQPNLTPKLAFCSTSKIVQQATSFFINVEMGKCAVILCSLYRGSKIPTKEENAAATALRKFFAQSVVQDSDTIFALGYELNAPDKHADGPFVMKDYMNVNVQKIVTGNYGGAKLVATFGATSYLCPYAKVADNNWQWAFFGTQKYIDGNTRYKGGDSLRLEPSGRQFRIKSGFGTESFLCTKSVSSNNYQWAFFGAANYISSYGYTNGQYFRLYPVSGGAKFKVESTYGATAYLCSNGKVPTDSYQNAFFGTSGYFNGNYDNELTLTFVGGV